MGVHIFMDITSLGVWGSSWSCTPNDYYRGHPETSHKHLALNAEPEPLNPTHQQLSNNYPLLSRGEP